MRIRIIVYLCLLTAFNISCTTSGGKKFTGTWYPLSTIPGVSTKPITILKNGNDYQLSAEGVLAGVSALQYHKKEDCLTGDAGGITIAVKYNKKTRHITIGPKNIDFISQFMEFEKIK